MNVLTSQFYITALELTTRKLRKPWVLSYLGIYKLPLQTASCWHPRPRKVTENAAKTIDSGSSSLGTDSGYLNDSGRLRRVPHTSREEPRVPFAPCSCSSGLVYWPNGAQNPKLVMKPTWTGPNSGLGGIHQNYTNHFRVGVAKLLK